MKYIILIAIFALVLRPLYVIAGWEITGRIIDREGNTILKRYFIQDSEIKVEKYDLIYSCNLKTESIIIVDPINLVFVKTTLKAYQSKLLEIKLNKISELLEFIPDDQKKKYESLYKAKAEQEIVLHDFINDSLIIRQLADTVKLMGYDALKFNITSDGRKLEEFFFTSEVNISKDINMGLFLQYAYLLEPEDFTIKYMVSKKYLETVKDGLVIRRFMFQDGYRTEWQVNKIDNKNIPAYEFGEPDLCKEISLDKWLTRRNQNEEIYYDDYE